MMLPVMRRPSARAGRVVCLLLLVVAPRPAAAYNSEEHKLLVDLGVSDVVLPRGLVLPSPTAFAVTSTTGIVGEFKAAKEKAVGFQSNDETQFSSQKKGPQDNSYWGPDFHQQKYNVKLWIPEGPGAALVRSRRLWVRTHLDAAPRVFTLGELSALYGDYRRTTHCAGAECYLTPSGVLKSSSPNARYAPNGNMFFKRGYNCFGGIVNCGWEPTEVRADTYLRYVASGVVPPFNVLGNVAYLEDDYGEAGWWGDELMRIASTNDWHFSSGALAWYVGMHRMALLAVDRARTDPTAWNKALHYEANALHSLVDLFAFGHVVVSRGETSWGIVQANGEGNAPAFRWMQHVLEQGGARRVQVACGGSTTCMRIELRPDIASTLPPLVELPSARSDFLRTYVNSVQGVSWARWANSERGHHDTFNASGACVRNLLGDSFRILGDGALRSTVGTQPPCGPNQVATAEVVREAVRASVQSLFDAYVALEGGKASVDSLAAPGASTFAALKYLPAYVLSDSPSTVDGRAGGNRFAGRWVSYAHALDGLSGAGALPAAWASCAVKEITATVPPPEPNQPRCQAFPLLLLPGDREVASGEKVLFVAKGGGDGMGMEAPRYVWALERSASGASVDAATGEYLAGPRGGVDVVQVRDEMGNLARATVTVTPPPPSALGQGPAEGSGSDEEDGAAQDGTAGAAGPGRLGPVDGCGCGATGGAAVMLALMVVGGLVRRGRRRHLGE